MLNISWRRRNKPGCRRDVFVSPSPANPGEQHGLPNLQMLNASTKHGIPRKLSDLSAHRTLIYRGPDRLITWQAKTSTGWVEVQSHPVFICNVGRELVEEALAGTGLTLSFAWGVATELARGDLVEVTLEDAELAITRSPDAGIFLLYNQPKYRLNKIKASVDFLVAELS